MINNKITSTPHCYQRIPYPVSGAQVSHLRTHYIDLRSHSRLSGGCRNAQKQILSTHAILRELIKVNIAKINMERIKRLTTLQEPPTCNFNTVLVTQHNLQDVACIR